MLILATLSGLLYNTFREHIPEIRNITSWNMLSWNSVLFLVIPLIVILLTRKLKLQFWKVLLILFFCLLVLLQPSFVWILIAPVAVVLLYLVWFPIQQVYYSFRIWLYEVIRGTIISIENRDGVRGMRIQRNILTVRIFMVRPNCIEDERIYFNEHFFRDFVMSNEWVKIRKE